MEITCLQEIVNLLDGTIQWKTFNIIICNKKDHTIITLRNQLFVMGVAGRVTSTKTV